MKQKSPAKATDANKPEEKAASRASIIAALQVGETYTISSYLEDDVRAENIKDVMAQTRKQMSERLSSTLKFCHDKTGNVYSRESHSGMTSDGRFAVSVIIERTA